MRAFQLRETYPLPKLENMLAQVKESKYFNKLYCNSGFWPEKLEPDSRLLTTLSHPSEDFVLTECPLASGLLLSIIRRK